MSADNWATCPKCGKESSLREDYHIGIRNSFFVVEYSGVCGHPRSPGCGFEFHFASENPVEIS